jgi:lysophospholipase L1-like esterase
MSSSERSLRGRPLLKAVAWVVYVAALCALVELGVRALDVVPPFTPQPELAIKLFYEDPNGLVLLRPNALYYTNGNVPMIVNSDGYRDRVYPVPRQHGVARIAVVGDSFTMGDGVRVEDSYPDQLEAMFGGEGHPVEVINFGITATNTPQQLALVRTKVIGYSPDVVIVGFNLNDYKINKETDFERAKRTAGIGYEVNADRTVRVVPPPRTLSERLKNTLNNRFAVVRLTRAAKEGFFGGNGPVAGPGDPVTAALVEGREIPLENYGKVNQALVAMRDVVRASGARFVVLFIPAMTELSRPYPETMDDYPYVRLHDQIDRFLADNGITYVEAVDFFKGRRVGDVIVSRFDPHFNQDGNAVIAKGLHDFLVRERLVGASN